MMLNGISWGTYLGSVAVLAGLYYSGVGLFYYKQELSGLLSSGFKKKPEDDEDGPTSAMALTAYELFIREVDAVITGLGKEATKPEVIAALRPMVTDYATTKNMGYLPAAINHIAKKVEDTCGVWVIAQDLVVVD